MVSQVKMPTEHAEFFRELAALPEDQIAGVTKAVRDARPSLEALIEALDGYAADKRTAVSALIAFSTWRVGATHSVEDALERLEKQFEETDLSVLTELLSAQPLVVLAKAVDLSVAHDKVFNTARIVSDLRPIYGEAVESGPVAYTIGHELILGVVSNSEAKDLYLSLDRGDLDTLRIQIERAIDKHDQLSAIVGDNLKSTLIVWDEETA